MNTSILTSRTLLLFVLFFVSSVASAIPEEAEYRGELLHAGYLNNQTFNVPIGFTFDFYGYSYNNLYVTTNGLVSFTSFDWNHWHEPIPSPETPNNFIAPFWDGLVINESGDLMYQTVGTAPNRKLIVQWRNMAFEGSTILTGTFQIILYEGSNNIQMQYRNVANVAAIRPRGATAVIGIENYNGTEGISCSYHTTGFAYNGRALRFTPDGGSYLYDDNANYDPMVLTNGVPLAAPVDLISPAQGSTVGETVQFAWEGSANAAAYNVIISASWDLSNPIHTSADLTGYSYEYTLPVDQYYFWSVRPKNSEGSTSWSSIRSFYTRTTPPLTSLPRTYYIEQGEMEVITLGATEGDGTARTATITSLPAEGTLYQDNGGFPGAAISTVPTALSSAYHTLFYSAGNNPGTELGSFNFEFSDLTSAPSAALTTIHVLPHGIPAFVYAAKETDRVEITFDRNMADPTGKHLEFAVRENSTDLSPTSCQLKPGDPKTIVVYVSPAINTNNVITVSYTKGSVLAESTGELESFTFQEAGQRAQNITFDALDDKTFGGPDFTINASASSGLTLRYNSSDLNVISLAGNTASINNLGESMITVTQDGNSTYAPARAVQLQRVSKLPATITISNLSQEYTGSGIEINTVTDPVGLTVDVRYNGSFNLPVDIGPYTVFAEIDDENYGGSQTAQLLVFDGTDPVPDQSSLPDLHGECWVDPPIPTATDFYAGTISATTTTTLPVTTQGTSVITWVYDDGNGNTVTQNQNVILEDLSGPVIPVLEDLSGECSVTAVPPSTNDDCAGTIIGTTTDPLTYDVQGSYVIHWTFDDGNGNAIVVPQNVLVADLSDPVPPVLEDLSGECSVTAIPPSTNDDCAGSITGTTTDPLTYDVQGSYVIHWTFDDGNGNAIVVPQNVLVADLSDPVLPVLEDLGGECSVTAIAPSTNDDCAGSITGTTTDPLTYDVQGSYVIHWTFDDGNGNAIVVPQNVLVADLSDPVIPSLPDVTGECIATAAEPTTTDACSGTILGSTTDALTYATPGTHIITWTFDDGNGNRIYVPQNVIVEDVTPPSAVVPDDVVSCDGFVSSIGLTAITDNCATPEVSYELSGATTGIGSEDASGEYFNPGVTVVTYTLNDGNGNSTAYQFTVTHQEVEEPVVSQADGTLSVSNTGSYQWINCDGNTLIPGETSSSFTPSISGEFAVILTQGACSKTSVCYAVTISGLGNAAVNGGINIYPNPAHNYVHVEMDTEQTNAVINVIDITGKSLLKEELDRFTGTDLDISTFKEGIYFIRIRSDQSDSLSRLVKE